MLSREKFANNNILCIRIGFLKCKEKGLISCSGGNFDNMADKQFIGNFHIALF